MFDSVEYGHYESSEEKLEFIVSAFKEDHAFDAKRRGRVVYGVVCIVESERICGVIVA